MLVTPCLCNAEDCETKTELVQFRDGVPRRNVIYTCACFAVQQ